MMITVFPMPFFLDKPENVVLLKDYAGRALKIYNEKYGTEWEVDNILKVNGGGCRNFIFYVTFSVKTSKGGKDIFQAMIEEDGKVEQGLEYNLEFPIIRPQPKKYSCLYAVV
nr:uncharacterized protein LOC104117088 [Nicotiana tomentosiformis]